MDIKTLLRELSRPHLLHWALDIAPKPHVWNHGAEAVLFKSHPTFQLMGLQRTPNPPNPSPLNTSVTPVLKCPIPLAPCYGEDLGY
jgi:hypothetical protein